MNTSGDARDVKESLAKLAAINPGFEADPERHLRLWFKSDEAVDQWIDGLGIAQRSICQ